MYDSCIGVPRNKNKVNHEGKGVCMNYTYVLECRDGSLYTGWTNNLEKRVRDHNDGRGAKYTKSRRPVRLAYYETYETKNEAMRREYEIKHMSRMEKLRLIGKAG